MARGLLLKWYSSPYRLGRDDGVRIRIEVHNAVGVTDKLFGYRMLPVSPYQQAEGHFSHVCSPVDLAEYPALAPTPGFSPEWFRLPFVDVLLRSVEEATNFRELVVEDVRRLVRTLNQMETLMPTGEETIGTTEDVSEDSDNSSDSSEGGEP